jgi:hypothetical protein
LRQLPLVTLSGQRRRLLCRARLCVRCRRVRALLEGLRRLRTAKGTVPAASGRNFSGAPGRWGGGMGTPGDRGFAKLGVRRTEGSAAHPFRGSKSKFGRFRRPALFLA